MDPKILVVAAFSWVSGQATNDWPILHNINHTGFSPTTVLRPPLKLKWAAKTPGSYKAGPVVAEGKVVVQSRDGYLFCFDAETGEAKWRYFVQRMFAHYTGYTETGPCISNGRVYANFFSAGHPGVTGMRCFDLETGDLIWKKPCGATEHRIHYSPQVTRGRVVFCSNRDIADKKSETPADWVFNAQVQCWNAATGDTLWTYTMASRYCQNTTLLAVGDTIYASVGWTDDVDSGKTVALDTNGNVLWESTAHHVSYYTGNMQYYDGNLWILARNTGGAQDMIRTSDWSIVLQGGDGTCYSKVSPIMNGRYYNRGYGGGVIAASIATGLTIPYASPGVTGAQSGCSGPAAANGYIYNTFGNRSRQNDPIDNGHEIVAINEQGTVVWRFKDNANHCASVAIAYDKLYAAAGTEGVIYCFENAQ